MIRSGTPLWGCWAKKKKDSFELNVSEASKNLPGRRSSGRPLTPMPTPQQNSTSDRYRKSTIRNFRRQVGCFWLIVYEFEKKTSPFFIKHVPFLANFRVESVETFWPFFLKNWRLLLFAYFLFKLRIITCSFFLKLDLFRGSVVSPLPDSICTFVIFLVITAQGANRRTFEILMSLLQLLLVLFQQQQWCKHHQCN